MIINADNLDSAAQGFRVLFGEEAPKVQSFHKKIVMETKSTSASETYFFLRSHAQLREWLGDRRVDALEEFGFTIRNKEYEATVGVKRTQFDDDQLGAVEPSMRMMAHNVPRHYDDLTVSLMLNGFTALGYDGKIFFATDHDTGGNKGTARLAEASFKAARIAMMKQKDHKGRAMGVYPTILCYGPDDEDIVGDIILSDRKAGGARNPLYNAVEPVLVHDLDVDGTYPWFLFDTRFPIGALVLQIRAVQEADWLDDYTKNRRVKELLFGLDTRDNGGYGLFEFAYGSTGEA